MTIHYPLNEATLKNSIVNTLKHIYDPEIPVNIYDLGLIYHIFIDVPGHVTIQMTLTTPGCPVAQTFPSMVENAVNAIDGVHETQVELVWDPPWTSAKMSEAAKLQLGML
ncbi:SUF system Fe-S cluster assembly protein [Rickettsiella grylli]|uniref:FeS assembly SUF system protein n=1 Tax=Rickettsiella grylli TaxID=59196 RepID=A8PN12_9COXI|nr:SUF system Fe-S cluster assembly protein [Rickettsiella grylli]EDP45860.1 FeS assembly SUF system protein [Rickettsiella grylli]